MQCILFKLDTIAIISIWVISIFGLHKSVLHTADIVVICCSK